MARISSESRARRRATSSSPPAPSDSMISSGRASSRAARSLSRCIDPRMEVPPGRGYRGRALDWRPPSTAPRGSRGKETTMQYRRLGSSGLQLSALSFGAWATFGGAVARGEARNLVAAAWDHGVNFFDNAETYANGAAEQVMGDVIADLRLPRDGFAVSSKVYFGAVDDPRPTQRGLSRKHVHD